MNGNFMVSAAALAALALGAQPASARQDLRDLDVQGRTDIRAVAAITIPLGGPRQARETAPRFDFAMQSQRIQADDASVLSNFDARRDSRVTLARTAVSFTFEQNPRLLMNGHRLATFGPWLTADNEEDSQDDGGQLGTVGLVVLGVGAAIAGGFLFADVIVDDIEDSARRN